uniref:PUM-HD domain-containing protein n=1 Tax=Ascaris lumbricoides TaxID=6252 RepID=A0A0M3I8V4_ASCLU
MVSVHVNMGRSWICANSEDLDLLALFLDFVAAETGGLFSLTVRLMELFSVHQYNFTPLINNLALYCQIRDDYINLCSRDYAELKSFAEDLTDGKFSFPIVAAVRHGDADDEILNILRQKTKDNEVKKYCIRLLHERGAISHTLNRLKQLHDAILSEVKNLGGNELLENLVETLSHELINDSNGTKRTHLTTKKCSLKIIHLADILRQKTKDNEVKKYCIRLLHERGAIRYAQAKVLYCSHTLNRLKQLHDAILSEVKNLGGNELLENLVETLSHELINDSNGTKRTHLTTKK